ncbi:MAG: O-antigen ligase family protein [Psychroflexus halocasei]
MPKKLKSEQQSIILANLSLFFVLVATFFLPIKTSLSNIGLGGLLVTTAFSFWQSGFKKQGKFIYLFLFSSIVFFLPMIWAWTYSSNLSEAWRQISKNTFLYLTPLIIFRKDLSILSIKKYAFYGLIGGSVLISLALIILNIYAFSQSNYSIDGIFNAYYTGFEFIKPLNNMHPMYMGIYFVMALSILCFNNFKLPKSIQILSFLILTLSIIFLASRIIYSVYLIIVLLFAFQNLSLKYILIMSAITAVIVILSFDFLQKTYIYNKVVKGTLWELQENVGTNNLSQSITADSRWSRWVVANEAIKEKPVFGYGTGTEKDILLQQYHKYDMQTSINQEYNMHNQFMSFLLQYGVIGFILLIAYFLRNIILAFKARNLLFICFLMILFLPFLVENVLDRNMGKNFIALFGTIFYADTIIRKK